MKAHCKIFMPRSFTGTAFDAFYRAFKKNNKSQFKLESWTVGEMRDHLLKANPWGITAADKNCAILTARGNLTVATDFKSNPVDMWYNRDEKENRFRMNYSFGCNIKEEALCVTMVND